MAQNRPPELAQLLEATDARTREAKWAQFLELHHRTLLHVCRLRARDYDATMDAYTWVLERLRENDCRRLRAYAADGRSTFTTWLVVVAKRLCIDFARQRYGRADPRHPEERDKARERRRLIDLTAEELDLDTIVDPSGRTPESDFEAAALREALRESIIQLSPQDRLLLALRFEDGLTAERIAPVLNFASVFHVYRRLNHVLAELRERLGEGPSSNRATSLRSIK
ncbi:MAG TPA: sigma-70 family RNA polymerase sigma factor [Gemmatimonadaceae bacterium]|jgi:RNA polymerase sigma factor (sigma-70 family)